MNLLRRMFDLDFPDPAVGQVWRSRHSGRAIRVAEVRHSDCGSMWHIDLHHEDAGGFIAIPMSYCMFPWQWRRMLRDEGRQLMGSGAIVPSTPWPRSGNVNPPPHYPRPPAPPSPPSVVATSLTACNEPDCGMRVVPATVKAWAHQCPHSTGQVLLPQGSICTNCAAKEPAGAATGATLLRLAQEAVRQLEADNHFYLARELRDALAAAGAPCV